MPSPPPSLDFSRAPWRLLLTPPLDGAENMALDVALMTHAAATGEWIFRAYSWSRPTLSLGRNQAARGAYDEAALAARGIDVVRRPTGGRALLHDREVTYSVTAPAAHAGSLRESYARINRLLLEALRRLGVEATLAEPAGRAAPPSLTPCFEQPSAGEIVFRGRKLAGSAQWRDRGALLQHGSLLLAGDQSLVASLLRDPLPLPPAPATLGEALGREPSTAEVADALFGAVRGLEDAAARPLALDGALEAEIAREAARFRDAAWTWRR